MIQRRWITLLLVFVAAILILGFWSLSLGKAAPLISGDKKPTPPPEETITTIQQAIHAGMASRAEYQPVYAIAENQITNIRVSEDEKWASAWLQAIDPETGEPIPTEPGLVLLQNIDGTWTPAFPGDTLWEEWLSTAPDETIPAQEKDYWLFINQEFEAEIPSAPLTGYLLPWPNGLTRKLSGSVAHDAYIPSGNAHYAFDFYLSGQMWNIHASKAGTVWRWKDNYENNQHYDSNGNAIEGNYIVIKDSSSTYQLYLHLAKNSIPAELKVVGAPVQQGQFIGIADNTGGSTGHHLHFMVHTNPSSYWGTSVDIVFGDVAINGGRPRLKRLDIPGYNDEPYCWPNANFPNKPKDQCSQFQEAYVSGNVYYLDTTPPFGGITAPQFGANSTLQSLTINGWASDAGVGLKSAQIRAYFNGSWIDIGTAQTASPFSYSWNLCSSNVPDGPVSLSLRLMDNVNNTKIYDSLVTFVKNYNCPLATPQPPAACSPSTNQVVLYSSDNFRGDCVINDVGSYASGADLGVVGDNRTASIKVGNNVLATVFSDVSFSGRSETLSQDDPSLVDNMVGSNKTSSLRVQLKATIPYVPETVWPAAGGTFTQTLSLSLYWRDRGGASQFQARLIRGSEMITSTWLTEPFWHLGTGVGSFSLIPGNYTWQVRAGNTAGSSPWSSPQTLMIVAKAVTSGTKVNAPYSDPMEGVGDWQASGLWHLESAKPAASGTRVWWYGYCNSSSGGCDEYYYNGKTGDLTSPPIQIPPTGNYYLRFKYRYQTESPGRFWDQRWVQINVDNGTFVNLYQLSDDLLIYSDASPFLLSPVIDLLPYAGHIVQIRFHFDTMDVSAQTSGGDNDYEGWYIDDFSVTTDPPVTCSFPDLAGNTSTHALGIALNSTVDEVICPAGDLDYFQFNGIVNTWVTANIEHPAGSPIDTVLQLIGEDGGSILMENDDERYPDILDSWIRFYIPRTGVYFLKVKDWYYPGTGDSSYAYKIGAYQDSVDPSAHIVFPTSSTLISNTITLRAQVSDSPSGVDRVEFYFHNYQWSDPAWKMLGYGAFQGEDWVLPFDPSTEAVQFNAAFLILAYDRAGNVYANVLWNAKLADRIFFTRLPGIMKSSP
jgi:murein DD-endopeptidase MepM/ murein hydrolase activator NlpD